jgi:ATPase subunit of ABC transporter with duplicated ATPase domains
MSETIRYPGRYDALRQTQRRAQEAEARRAKEYQEYLQAAREQIAVTAQNAPTATRELAEALRAWLTRATRLHGGTAAADVALDTLYALGLADHGSLFKDDSQIGGSK